MPAVAKLWPQRATEALSLCQIITVYYNMHFICVVLQAMSFLLAVGIINFHLLTEYCQFLSISLY